MKTDEPKHSKAALVKVKTENMFIMGIVGKCMDFYVKSKVLNDVLAKGKLWFKQVSTLKT